MKYNPEKHHRRSIRLKGYDYSQPGWYFVTIVTQDREMLFGEIANRQMKLNNAGRIVHAAWEWLVTQYHYVELGAWVIMPNHLHGIIVIVDDCRGGSRTAPTEPTIMKKRKSIGRIIGAFKTVSTKRINQMRNTPGAKLWQRNYYEHISRDENDLNRIRKYIIENPMKWPDDKYYAGHHPNL